ncbi:MAG: NADH:ubiquinone reductase (Na(+)-transporting) subunit F [Candidatus Marinimicrobia bacterium]|nr:NADH:ubiquinone reductase (Na(+)-transporting) subunit F [Candidatus Neomarinimicrobiota bacterium]
MLFIISSIVTFLVIALLLTAAITFIESKLVYKGNVKIKVNDDPDHILSTQAGDTLLNTLNENGIFIPSGCGGSGTCGVCKCQVTEGGGELLPTEESYINRKMAKEHWRLSCQVKVKNDMALKVPDEIFNVKKWECKVLSNKNVSTYIKEFVVQLPEKEILDFRAGGYIQIDVPKYSIQFKDFNIDERFQDEWREYGIFDLSVKNHEATSRAYSMANYPVENHVIKLNVRIATPPWDRKKKAFKNVPSGICSSYIFSLKPGDKVSVSGPYGEFFAKATDKEMVFIGGGAGMAPMRSHIFDQLLRLNSSRKMTFWYGARSLREVFYQEEFDQLAAEKENFQWHLALSDPRPEDNWSGLCGFIHKVLYDHYLKDHESPEECEYYICGPPMMISAITKMLDDLGVEPENILYDDFG